MSKIEHKKLLFLSVLAIFLTACGEGTTSDDNPPADPNSEATAQPVAAAEATTTTDSPVVEVPDNTTYKKGIKKTGQIKSYELDGDEDLDGLIKDDGYYQKGVTPSYSRSSEIVTDNITGLMWQDNQEVANIKKEWLSDDNFEVCNRDNSADECADTTGDTASTYCQELVLGGYSDWRLPIVGELQGIVTYDIISPAIDSVFINKNKGIYWSSSKSRIAISAWAVRFNYGYTMNLDTDGKYYVRCVREK